VVFQTAGVVVMATLVLADLHGRADLLEGVLKAVSEDTKFVFIGDSIDRGPRNRDTVRLLAQLADEGRMILLKGNHEAMVEEVDATYDRFQREKNGPQGELRRFDARVALENWIKNGADTVIPEYGGWDSDAQHGGTQDAFGIWGLPPELLEYTARCQLEYRQNGILCAHAAPPVKVKGHRTIEESMIWARPEDGPFALPDGVTLSVHGHTPIRAPMRLGDNVFIDLGAVWTGHLCAFELETESITVFQGDGQVPLANLPVLEPAGGVDPVILQYTLVNLK
jgi:serine/threonine protein phosphatase 1